MGDQRDFDNCAGFGQMIGQFQDIQMFWLLGGHAPLCERFTRVVDFFSVHKTATRYETVV
jgi:hypothetical protein